MHSMWLADFANYVSEVLAVLPDNTQSGIKNPGNFSSTTVEAATYKGLVYGFPTEYNQWALVYNRALFEQDPDVADILTDLENDVPLSWADFEYAAHELTVWNTTVSPPIISQTGFVPFVEGMPEEQRYQFLSLLWSNGGDYVDLTVPTTLFSNQSGYQVMQLYHRLGGYESPEDPPEDPYQSYDPLNQPDYWWSAWADQTLSLIHI